VALSSPAAARRCNAWQWLVVAFSAKQKQQLYHQQLTNGTTILKTFTFPVNLDLYNLFTVSFGSSLANISQAIYILSWMPHSMFLGGGAHEYNIVIGHGILARTYLAEYRDSLK